MSRGDESVFPMLACSQNVASGETTQFQYCANLTIREHFAGQALAGILVENGRDEGYTAEGAAARAVRMADALIAKLAEVKK